MIFDLPVCRLRQIVKNIEERVKAQHLRNDMIIEWQTKTLASFIASTVPTEEGKTNPLAEAVDQISLVDPEELKSIGSKKEPEPSLEEIIEKGSPHAGENVPGSAEALMRIFPTQ